MAVGFGLLVVMPELDNHIVAWFDTLQNLVPSAFVDEALRAATVHSVVVYHNVIGIKALLQHHGPPALLLTTGCILVGSCRVANHKNGGMLVGSHRCKEQQSAQKE